MTVRYAVTFEFDLRPPVTARGTVKAGQEHTLVSRAVKEAKRTLRPVNWSSMVVVLLERLPDTLRADEVAPENAETPIRQEG